MAEPTISNLRAQVACGVLAGPLFASAFTVIGAKKRGYDWKRNAVSSLAVGEQGWMQRANFIATGTLFTVAGQGLRRCPRTRIGPRMVSSLITTAGLGLIGSGIFVTDQMITPPPSTEDDGTTGTPLPTATLEGKLHNVCAIPIFAGLPIAGLVGAAFAARQRDYRWASSSAALSLGMPAGFVLMGMAFRRTSRLAGTSGIFQRISIVSGFGWLSALSLRALRSLRQT